jgi:hypothetical protein
MKLLRVACVICLVKRFDMLDFRVGLFSGEEKENESYIILVGKRLSKLFLGRDTNLRKIVGSVLENT